MTLLDFFLLFWIFADSFGGGKEKILKLRCFLVKSIKSKRRRRR